MKTLCCNTFCLLIDTIHVPQFRFPPIWEAYHSEEVKGHVIHITLTKSEEDPRLLPVRREAWHGLTYPHERLVAYAEQGKEIVRISQQLGSSDHFTVMLPHKSLQGDARTGIQFAMLLGLSDQAFGFHGVTVIVNDKAILLSAPSGTGKTTLSNLLAQYCEAEIINGDFAVLAPNEQEVLFLPTPFCGSSGICQNRVVPIDLIVFLAQAKENTYRPLGAQEALTHMMTNALIPSWDGALATVIQRHIFKTVEQVPMGLFAFAPNQEAAEMLHQIVTQ